jgi:hypothetical protein
MPINPNDFIIKDTQTGLWLTQYSILLANCVWGSNFKSAAAFDSQEQADAAILQWGETPGARFIGQNPPPR